MATNVEMTPELKETFDGLLAIGKVLGDNAIRNRKITLIYRGKCDATAWSRAPRRLARKTRGPNGASVHFSPKHPDVIVVITSGRWDYHLTPHDVHQMIGGRTEVKAVLGENHPDIPFYVGCEKILESAKTQVLSSLYEG